MGKVARQITEMESRESLDSPITTHSYPATTQNMCNTREGTNEVPMYRDIPNILSQPPNISNQHAVTEVPNFRGLGSQQTIAGYTRTHTDNHRMTYEQNSTNNLMHTSRNQGSQGPNVQSNSQCMQFSTVNWTTTSETEYATPSITGILSPKSCLRLN